MTWWVYLLECGDRTLYCGIAQDVDARLAKHRDGVGARYTKGRGPLAVVYREACGTRSDALKRELRLKRLSRKQKLALIAVAKG